ncbi:O-antigen polymerase [Paraglaciecola chathamensis]|nr:O-antigen polymerase [Paraglaciecola chathamensis]
MFYINLILQSFISSVIVVNGWEDHYRISRQLTTQDSRLYGWLAVQWVMLAMPIAMYMIVIFSGFKSTERQYLTYIRKPIEEFTSRNNKSLFKLISLLTGISLLAVCYTFYTIGFIPQLKLFSLSGLLSAELREDVGRGFEGSFIFRNIFALTLTPILSYIWFAYSFYYKKRRMKLVFYIMLIASLLIVSYNLAKSPIVFYLIGLLFLNVYIKGGVKISKIVYLFLFLFCILIFSYYLTFDSFDILHLLSINSGIGGRVLLGQSMGIYFSMDVFPKHHEFLGMNSVSQFVSNIIGNDYSPRSARILMEHVNPKGVANGTAGLMNSLYIGEAWANWGIFGVFIAPFIVGFYIQTIFMFFITSKKHPIYLGLFAYLSFRLPVVGGVNDFIYNPIHVILFIIFFSYLFMTSKSRLRN